MAGFYSAILGWEIAGDDDDWIALANPDGGVALSFQSEQWYSPPVWPEEPGAPSKMLHLEIAVEDVEAAVAIVIGAGGREAPTQPVDRSADQLRVMLDPAGHPFCLVRD